MRRITVFTGVLLTASILMPPSPAGAQQRVVAAVLFRYNPSQVEIASGDALVFFNADPMDGEGHSLTHAAPPGEQLFDSSITASGETSDVPGVAELSSGTYGFTCRVHAYMSGTLVVGRAS